MDAEPPAGGGAAGVAEKVRAFYERHPYPPPIDSLEKYRRLWQDQAQGTPLAQLLDLPADPPPGG